MIPPSPTRPTTRPDGPPRVLGLLRLSTPGQGHADLEAQRAAIVRALEGRHPGTVRCEWIVAR